MQNTGVVARGIVTPIFRQGDDIVKIICDSVQESAKIGGFTISDRDILAVTEAVVGRVQGNYATCEQISKDVRTKLGGGTVGIVFPILSRNRFSNLLCAIGKGCDNLIIQLSYPQDEVGNGIITIEDCDNHNVNPYLDNFTLDEFRRIFGNNTVHRFTGVDYIEYYQSLVPGCQIVFSNDPCHILKYTKKVLTCDIHNRKRTQNLIRKAGAEICLRLDEIMTSSVDGSGYSEYGLLGSNKATETSVKLFPRDTDKLVHELQSELLRRTGKTVEVMVYGDGGFKDPVGGIWELADPVVSPAYTAGLAGTPNELKIKYIADNDFASLSGDELTKSLVERIKNKDSSLVGKMDAEGTTPRRIFDLVGSLCDLVSGSGDRGTPVVLVSNYFKNFASSN